MTELPKPGIRSPRVLAIEAAIEESRQSGDWAKITEPCPGNTATYLKTGEHSAARQADGTILVIEATSRRTDGDGVRAPDGLTWIYVRVI